MACIDSLQRLPEVEKLARQVDAIIIFGWTERMTTRTVEVARAFNDHVHKIEKVDDLRLDWLRGVECTKSRKWMISGSTGCGEWRKWALSARTKPRTR